MPNLPYLDKHDPFSSHSVIAGWLAGLPPGTRILDVGAASGTLGRLCQGRGFVLNGIEPVASWAESARPLYADLSATLLSATPDAFIQGHGVVVCADILEHTADPAAELRRLVDLQPGGAVFLISVPNVANLWVRLSLLLGRFEYAERGILDRTHLRFFTRASLLRLVQEAGLAVQQVRPTPIPLNLVSPFFERAALGRGLHRLLHRLTQIFPTLLGYQFVVYAVKPSH
jgi:2-polyprenyl-3-methyl-5-hydroxy-6-metoxy-1,4-benzoquinol methylase